MSERARSSKTVAARGYVNGRGPRPQAVGGIGPKVRSFGDLTLSGK